MTDLDFWREAWAAGRVHPRSKRPDDTLEMHWPSLKVALGSRVLVPLSGKSGDLAWLGSHGFFTVGVEISAIPCEAFFAERGVQPVRTGYGSFVRWQGFGVTLLQGDFFNLDGHMMLPSIAARSSHSPPQPVAILESSQSAPCARCSDPFGNHRVRSDTRRWSSVSSLPGRGASLVPGI
jgi:hypothetical protein